MTRQKRIALALAGLFLLATAFAAGCTAKNPAENPYGENTKLKEIDFNLGGRRVNIGFPNVQSVPNANNQNNSAITKIILDRVAFCEQKYNCDIQLIPYSSTIEWGFIRDGSSTFDIIRVGAANAFPSIVSTGLAIPLDKYLPFGSTILDISTMENTVWEGEHYAITDTVVANNDGLLVYNKTLLQSKGLPDPYDLMQQGNWTWDAFLDMCQKVTGDSDADGIVDTWGVYTGSPFNWINLFTLSNGASYVDDSSGSYQYAFDSDAAVEAVAFVSKLYNDSKVMMDRTLAQNNAHDKASLDAIQKYRSAFSIASVPDFSTRNGSEYGTVMFPKGPQTSTYVATGGRSGNFYFVTASCKDPEKIARLMYDMFIFWDPEKDSKLTIEDYKDSTIYRDTADQAVRDKIDALYAMANANFVKTSTMTTMSAFGQAAQALINDILYERQDPGTVLRNLRATVQPQLDQMNASTGTN